jgi:hypothetical protein
MLNLKEMGDDIQRRTIGTGAGQSEPPIQIEPSIPIPNYMGAMTSQKLRTPAPRKVLTYKCPQIRGQVLQL